MANVIAIKEGSAKALRQRMQQIEVLNAQMRGFVDALAAENDVPAGYQFDLERMAFVEPQQPQGAVEGEGDNAG